MMAHRVAAIGCRFRTIPWAAACVGALVVVSASGQPAAGPDRDSWSPPDLPVLRDARAAPEEKWSVRDASAALAQAAAWLGDAQEVAPNGPAAAPAGRAVLGVSDEDLGPGIGVLPRPVWHVTIELPRLTLPDVAPEAEPRARRLDMFVDPVDGALLKAVIVCPACGSDHYPEPPAKVAAERIYGGGFETWLGIPGSPPRVSLLSALAVVEKDGLSSAFAARTIVAHCVSWSFMHRPAEDIWSIHIMGAGQLPIGGPADAPRPVIDPRAVNHLRHIVDATTGKWLKANNTPQPDVPVPAETHKSNVPPPAR